MGSYLYFQSGGPTAVINSSLNGVIRRCKDHGVRLYGAVNGVEGLIHGQLVDLSAYPYNRLVLLRQTPGAALGSSRLHIDEHFADWKAIEETVAKYDIEAILVNGGNDSMDTAHRLYEHFSDKGIPVVGIPKTIDNDLMGTDFCPGYPSACRHVMNAIASIVIDGSVYSKGKVNIIEIQGREAGWVTASASLLKAPAAPDLLLMPEIPFQKEKVLQRIREIYEEKGSCFIAMSEGVDIPHEHLDKMDSFGHHSPEGASFGLGHMIKDELGYSTRCTVLGTLCRSNPYLISLVDSDEAQWLGEAAVDEANSGHGGVMVGLRRGKGKVAHFTLISTPLLECANAERKFPLEWIHEDGSIDKRFAAYLEPLLRGNLPVKTDVNGLFQFAEID